MRRSIATILLATLTLLVSTMSYASADNESPIKGTVISTRFAIQMNDPMQITLIHKTIEDQLSAVTVRNQTGKEIRSFTLYWSVFVPATCSESTLAREDFRAQSYEGVITPHGEVNIKGLYPLKTQKLLEWANLHKAHYVIVQVGIGEVVFGDWTTWSHELPGPDLDSESAKCRNGELLQKTILSQCKPVATMSPNLSLSESPKILDGRASQVPNIRGCVYYCSASLQSECLNQHGGQYCDDAFCENPHACQNQVCEPYCP